MILQAYQEIYLSKAQSVLGDAFDYAVNVCGIPSEDFVKLFIVSSISKRMERGEPAFLAGKSGIELAKRSGVSLRSIQMYEQRNKDINKASVDTNYSIAKVLGCTMEDLVE